MRATHAFDGDISKWAGSSEGADEPRPSQALDQIERYSHCFCTVFIPAVRLSSVAVALKRVKTRFNWSIADIPVRTAPWVRSILWVAATRTVLYECRGSPESATRWSGVFGSLGLYNVHVCEKDWKPGGHAA